MSGMGWRCGAGGMLGALVLGAIGWPGTAAAQFSLPPSFNNPQTRAPGTSVPAAPAPPAAAVPGSGGVRSPPPMPGPGTAVGQVSLSLLARFGRDSRQITNGLVLRAVSAGPGLGGAVCV